jgi:hypothetical protein
MNLEKGLAACLALTVLTLAPIPTVAAAERLSGSRFIEVMEDNTLSGTMASGTAYNLYFLPGGRITYDDSTGASDSGHWSIDPDGDVCISFENADDGRAQCFRVELDGRKVTWRGKDGGSAASLRGGVLESFLKPR